MGVGGGSKYFLLVVPCAMGNELKVGATAMLSYLHFNSGIKMTQFARQPWVSSLEQT
jgi:hypothetical protein